MLAISTCPKCQRHVSLPAEMDRTVRVRCPFCEAEYPLDEAIPPELIPVDDRQENGPENEAAAVVARVPLGIVHVRKQPPKAWWRTPLEYVVTALLGCLIGYYALALWLGPELKSKGFPILSYLPGITWLTTPPEKVDGAEEKPAAGKQSGGSIIRCARQQASLPQCACRNMM